MTDYASACIKAFSDFAFKIYSQEKVQKPDFPPSLFIDVRKVYKDLF